MRFEVSYPPSVNNLYYNAGRGRRKTAGAKKWSTDCGWRYKAAGGRLLEGKVSVLINLYPPDDGRTRDVDNPIKVTLDSLKGVAWKDDSQVIAVAAIRFPAQSKVGRAEVKIWGV